MNDLKLSVIIPVYNSEKYLRPCVESITAQSYKNIEVILVDDGSTDSSPRLCDTLAEQDGRIVVIHKENGGTSSARNAGLDVASGDYVTFMDNDDFWNNKNAILEITSYLSESGADVLFHENTVYWQDTDKMIAPVLRCNREKVVNKSKNDALSSIIGSGIFSLYCVWAKVIKRSVIEENQIRFPDGMRNEDTYFCSILLLKARCFDFYDKSFYVYRKGHTGAQTLAGVKYSHLRDLQFVIKDISKRIDNLSDSEERRVLRSYLAFPYAVLIGQIPLSDDDKIKKDIPFIKSYVSLLEFDIHPSVKKIKLFYKIFGFSLTSTFLSVYIKRTNHFK